MREYLVWQLRHNGIRLLDWFALAICMGVSHLYVIFALKALVLGNMFDMFAHVPTVLTGGGLATLYYYYVIQQQTNAEE